MQRVGSTKPGSQRVPIPAPPKKDGQVDAAYAKTDGKPSGAGQTAVRYFILKSLTHYNIEQSIEKGIWATQVGFAPGPCHCMSFYGSQKNNPSTDLLSVLAPPSVHVQHASQPDLDNLSVSDRISHVCLTTLKWTRYADALL